MKNVRRRNSRKNLHQLVEDSSPSKTKKEIKNKITQMREDVEELMKQ